MVLAAISNFSRWQVHRRANSCSSFGPAPVESHGIRSDHQAWLQAGALKQERDIKFLIFLLSVQLVWPVTQDQFALEDSTRLNAPNNKVDWTQTDSRTGHCLNNYIKKSFLKTRHKIMFTFMIVVTIILLLLVELFGPYLEPFSAVLLIP